MMNIKPGIVVATSLLATAVTAMGAHAAQYKPPAAGPSRAQVKTEFQHAIADGELSARGDDYPGFDVPQRAWTTVTRAQVKAQVQRALANGELSTHGEEYPSSEVPQGTQVSLTRAQVKEEMIRAGTHGTWPVDGEAYGNFDTPHR